MTKNLKQLFFLISIIGLFFLNIPKAGAVLPPCTLEERMEDSLYVIEGYVVDIKCGDAYDSGECHPLSEELIERSNLEKKDFKPQLIADCIATIKVTKSLKGKYSSGDMVEEPFRKLIQKPEGWYDCKIPGSVRGGYELNSKIRYYASANCPVDSEIIEETETELENEYSEENKPLAEQKINWIYPIIIGLIVLSIVIYYVFKKRRE